MILSKVSKVVATRSFENAVKSLKKDHKTSVLKELRDTVDKLINLEITTQKANHPLRNSQEHKDLHLDGGRLILLYRYDAEALIISLRLQDVVNHDQLKSYDSKKYKAPTREYDPDKIKSSTVLCSYDEFITWYDNLPDEEQWKVDDVADTEGIPFYEDASDEQLSWLYDQFNLTHNKSKQIDSTNILGAKELAPYTSFIEVSLEGLRCYVDHDGYAVLDDTDWEGKSSRDAWYDDEYDVYLGDNDDILSVIHDTIDNKIDITSMNIPDTVYKISGHAELYYTVSGVEYEDTIYKDDESFERELFTDNATIDWDIDSSYVSGFNSEKV